jgi:hypothetical protein
VSSGRSSLEIASENTASYLSQLGMNVSSIPGVKRLIFAAGAADTRRVTDITPTEADRLLLEQLEEEERALSAQRRRLQDRIDLLPGAATGTDSADEGQLRRLREQERDVSERRRAVHDRIELLRAQDDQGGDDRSAA